MSRAIAEEHDMDAYIAIGSNIDDRLHNFNEAFKLLKELVGPIVSTSALYITVPQYVDDQPEFLNAVIKVSTKLLPENLLHQLKHIETTVGRTPSIRFGPRVIDLDIVFYGEKIVELNTPVGELVIPHPRLKERDFVLLPLCDIAVDFLHPVENKPIGQFYKELNVTHAIPQRILPVRNDCLWPLGKKTYIMGILNVTPDSFSDGGKFVSVDEVVVTAQSMINAGCDILDIGGESTRPHAMSVNEQEEISRVIPVILAIRKISSIPISIDTRNAHVARMAIQAGADIINDVSGGVYDNAMLSTVAELNVPFVMMHSRGTPDTMNSMMDYVDIVDDVIDELKQCLSNAEKAGIYRWNILLDPGIGFAKGEKLNCELLRRMKQFTNKAFRCCTLVGASRKGFLGRLCQKPIPKQRQFGTAATCAAAICGGVDILRVHDVPEMIDVARVSDAIWR